MTAHLFSPPPRVTDVVPSLPAALDQVIAIAMAKDPAARFGSATALADAAARALRDPMRGMPLPPIPSGDVSPYPPAPAWWQHSGPRTMAPWSGPLPTLTGAPPPKRRRRRSLIGAAVAGVVLITAVVTVAAWPGDKTAGPVGAGSARPSAQGPAGDRHRRPAIEVNPAERQ